LLSFISGQHLQRQGYERAGHSIIYNKINRMLYFNQYPETSNKHHDVLFEQCFYQKKWQNI